MNKFKKIVAGIAVSVGIGCLAGAGACAGAPKYYDLTFDSAGVDIIMLGDLAELDEKGNPFDAISGGKVQAGTEVRFTVSLGSNVAGTAKITVDGTEITPNEQGEYVFVIKKNSEVKVEGVSALYQLNLRCAERVQTQTGTYEYEERMFEYTDESGKTLGDTVTVREDEDFKFKLNVTPYYIRQNSAGATAYSVICGTQELVADANGVYTVTGVAEVPEEGLDVYVSGMEQEEPFANRENCGSGTEEDPYLISRPIDMFYIAALTNLDRYNYIYGRAYYKMVADIDMEGSQMFVIGDSSTGDSGTPASFGGHFDGNGHTIKNFYITDEVTEQESFEQAHLPFVGLFGYLNATEISSVEIKNLTLENCELRVNTALAEETSYAGMVAGYGIGAEITGCNVKNAEISVVGSDSYQTFVGGIAGVLQAAYGTTRRGSIVTYDSFAKACNVTDVDISGTGSLRVAGGITGYLLSSDINAISYAVNCTVTGDVNGGINTGGVAGIAGRFASIGNCYVSALVSASNSGEQFNEQFSYAYAGGIVGSADEDSVIYSNYVANENDIFASSVSGNRYQVTGDFAAAIAEGGTAAKDAGPALLLNNKISKDGTSSALFNELGWVAGEWNLSGSTPLAVVPAAEREITITVKRADGTAVGNPYKKTVGASLSTLSGWHRDDSLPEFLTENGKRSYGYFFGAKDGNLVDRVPYGFVPSASEITLYVGFADYNEVAGDYYVQSAPRSNGAYIKLTADGKAIFRNGGLYYSGTYYYDGTKVTLPFSVLASLSIDVTQSDGSKYAFVGTKIDGGNGLSFEGIAFVPETNSLTGQTTQTPLTVAFNAYRARQDMTYGEYATAQGLSFAFNVGMNGYYKSSTESDTFTYTISGDTITATYSRGGRFTATIEGGVVTKVNNVAVFRKNQFNGTYKHSANSVSGFTFDGISSVNGANYEVVQNRAVFTIGETQYEAFFNQEGFLVINGLTYYPADGFTGEWYFDGVDDSLEKIDIALEGISADGFGYATVNYVGGTSVRAQYDVAVSGGVSTVRIYSGDMQYGELTLDTKTGIASGMFYSVASSGYYANVTFNLYDSFKGIWVSNAEGIDTVIFNGKSATGIKSAVLRSENGAITHGEYTLTGPAEGTLKVGSDEYQLIYNELEEKVELKKTGADKTLAKRDGWYGTVLYDGETSYTFDGKGYIGGKVTVSDGTSLTYTIVNGTVTLGGETLTPNANGTGFTFGSKTLVFKTGFAGEWLVGGTQKKFTIGEVGSDFTAKATYEGESGEFAFVYSPADGTLTYKESVNGQELTTVLKTSGEFELSLGRTGGEEVTLSCIKADRQDGFMGVYVNANGSSWTFDGLGNCVFGDGTAIYKSANGNETKYFYKINKLGVPYISSQGWAFTEVEDGFKKTGAEIAYDMGTPNFMYEKRVFSDENSQRIWYVFDGFGTLYRDDNGTLTKAYDYEVVSDDTVTLKSGETERTGKLTVEGANTRMTIT